MRRFIRNFDDRASAKKIREDFYAKPIGKEKRFTWNWPTELIEVGECLGTLYRSDKWKPKGKFEEYKHKSEGEQRIYVVPGAPLAELKAIGLPLCGVKEKIPSRLMPQTFAELALFVGFQVRLYEEDSSGRYFLPEDPEHPDRGLYEFSIAHAMLGAGRCENGRAFLVAYHAKTGPYCFVFGEELDVEKDGIVG
jgi:hypothetical protein